MSSNNTQRMSMNTMNRIRSGFERTSSNYMIFIVVIILVAILIWYYYMKKRSDLNTRFNPVLISEPILMTNEKLSTTNLSIPNDHPYGIQYTYSYWLYINDLDYNFGVKKNVFQNAVTNYNPNDTSTYTNKRNPSVYIAENTNTLMIDITTGTTSQALGIQNFPIMRWVYVAIVLNNRSVDIYVDGRLERSFILPNIPDLPTSGYKFHVGKQATPDIKTFSGKISKLQYFSKALSPKEIFDLYQQSPISLKLFTNPLSS